MTKRKLALVISVLALVTVLGVASIGTAFAQTGTPQTQTTPATPEQPNAAQPHAGKLGRGFGFPGFWGGGNMAAFDAVAKALNLDPTELFNQLHSGKSLSDIAAAQGKTLADIQTALNADRVQAFKDRIAAAVKDGKMTQDQADWLLQGLDKGYFFGGHGFGFGSKGFGRGHGMMPGMRGFRNGGNGTQQPTPSTSSFGTSS